MRRYRPRRARIRGPENRHALDLQRELELSLLRIALLDLEAHARPRAGGCLEDRLRRLAASPSVERQAQDRAADQPLRAAVAEEAVDRRRGRAKMKRPGHRHLADDGSLPSSAALPTRSALPVNAPARSAAQSTV